ncbi:MAG: ABC transporter permease subunit [Bdellovibrionales bacterium]|nr:ABC transporter permease subunit [Bdellovibrionales bacterium]
MKSIRLVGWNTFLELLRNRILFGIVVFAILLMSLSVLLGQLSFAEQARITIDFGLTAIQLSSAMLSIFVGSTLISREVEKQTILSLLVRPMSRLQFLLGKALGLTMVNLLVVLSLALCFLFILLFWGIPLTASLFLGLLGILLESLVVLGVALFFSTMSATFMVVAFTFGIWLIGHWMESLEHFSSRSQSKSFEILSTAVQHIFPNLEKFNWSIQAVYGDLISLGQISYALLYAVGWFGLLITLAFLNFRRRDFV